MKKAEFMGWVLFTARSFDGRWWGWILNEALDYIYCGRIPCGPSGSFREAQRFVWLMAKERKGAGNLSEPEWIDVPAS